MKKCKEFDPFCCCGICTTNKVEELGLTDEDIQEVISDANRELSLFNYLNR